MFSFNGSWFLLSEQPVSLPPPPPIANDVSEDTHGEAPSSLRAPDKARLSVAAAEIIDGNL